MSVCVSFELHGVRKKFFAKFYKTQSSAIVQIGLESVCKSLLSNDH